MGVNSRGQGHMSTPIEESKRSSRRDKIKDFFKRKKKPERGTIEKTNSEILPISPAVEAETRQQLSYSEDPALHNAAVKTVPERSTASEVTVLNPTVEKTTSEKKIKPKK